MCDGVTLEIFRMFDSEDEFYLQYPFLCQYKKQLEEGYKASSRRKEILSEKILLEKLFPGLNVTLSHNSDGKPILSNGLNISISHTRNHIAMMVSKEHQVALDIEHISDRVKKVGRMYLRKDEPFTEVTEMLIAWCVKEAMYKLFSSQNLIFEEIRILPFKSSSEGTIKAENIRINQLVSLQYKVTSDYVLVNCEL